MRVNLLLASGGKLGFIRVALYARWPARHSLRNEHAVNAIERRRYMQRERESRSDSKRQVRTLSLDGSKLSPLVGFNRPANNNAVRGLNPAYTTLLLVPSAETECAARGETEDGVDRISDGAPILDSGVEGTRTRGQNRLRQPRVGQEATGRDRLDTDLSTNLASGGRERTACTGEGMVDTRSWLPTDPRHNERCRSTRPARHPLSMPCLVLAELRVGEAERRDSYRVTERESEAREKHPGKFAQVDGLRLSRRHGLSPTRPACAVCGSLGGASTSAAGAIMPGEVPAAGVNFSTVRAMRRIRWTIADWLSRFACALRGHKWYVADAWHGVPGNRASELSQQLRDAMVLRTKFSDPDELEQFNAFDNKLSELAQIAGENWGHVWPKETK